MPPHHLQVTSFAALAGRLHLTPSLSYVPVSARHPYLPERVLGELPRGGLQHELFVVQHPGCWIIDVSFLVKH